MVGLFEAGYLLGWRPYLTFDGTEIVVRNPVSEWAVPVDAVAAVHGDRSLLRLELRGGQAISVWAVQAANASAMSGLPSRVSHVAEQLTTALAERRTALPGGRLPDVADGTPFAERRLWRPSVLHGLAWAAVLTR